MTACFALFLLGEISANAKSFDKVSVFHSDGTAFASKPLVFETNILPGDEFRKNFYVEKKDNFDQVLMMRFKRKLTPRENSLARRITVRLRRISDSKYIRFPNNRTRISLWRLYNYRNSKDSDAFRFDTVDGPSGSRHQYELIFELNPRTGNRYQNKTTRFDLSAGVFSESTGVCSGCFCFWKKYCCHPQDWHCRWTSRFFNFLRKFHS